MSSYYYKLLIILWVKTTWGIWLIYHIIFYTSCHPSLTSIFWWKFWWLIWCSGWTDQLCNPASMWWRHNWPQTAAQRLHSSQGYNTCAFAVCAHTVSPPARKTGVIALLCFHLQTSRFKIDLTLPLPWKRDAQLLVKYTWLTPPLAPPSAASGDGELEAGITTIYLICV